MGILWYWMPLSQRLPVSVCEAAPISISRSAAALRQRGSVLTFAIGRFPHHTHTAFHWTGHKPAHVIGPDGALLATKFSRRSPAAPTHTRNAYKTEIAPPSPSHPTSGGEEKKIRCVPRAEVRSRERGRQQGTHTLEHKRYQTYKWLFSGPTCAPPGPPAQRAATGVAAPSAPRSAPPPACRYELGTEIEEN